MRHPRVLLSFSAAALAVATAIVGGPSSAQAASEATKATAAKPTQWQPYRSTGFEDAAGTVCAFALSGTPLRDHEQFRTTQSYPDGSPKVQEYRGPLSFRYTNEATGKSVVRNLAGTSYFNFRPDGSLGIVGTGHIGLTVHAGNIGHAQGEWVVSGGFAVVISTGDTEVTQVWGGEEDICSMLG